MKKINLFTIKFMKLLVIGILILLLIDLSFHKAPNPNNIFWKEISQNKKKREFGLKIPERKPFSDYWDSVKTKNIFYFAQTRKEDEKLKEETENPLDSFVFNGIIILDKKYLAVYNKKNKSQYLIAEGESFEGIKVKKILKNSVIIEIDHEEKEINF